MGRDNKSLEKSNSLTANVANQTQLIKENRKEEKYRRTVIKVMGRDNKSVEKSNSLTANVANQTQLIKENRKEEKYRRVVS